MSVVEQYARAHVLTDADRPGEDDAAAIPVMLRYDPDRDPWSVRVALPGGGPADDPREWSFSRDLLERGLRAPAESGEVRVWPCGRVQAVVEFHSAQGSSVVQFENKALIRFLRRTYRAAAAEPVRTPVTTGPGTTPGPAVGHGSGT